MFIKREVLVLNPNSGGDRWSIDFFLADRSRMLTFVECQRYKDTLSKREVIGRMLEYAANGQYYWQRADLNQYAGASLFCVHLKGALAVAACVYLESRIEALREIVAGHGGVLKWKGTIEPWKQPGLSKGKLQDLSERELEVPLKFVAEAAEGLKGSVE
jgi:hypothetical protein